MLRLTFCGFLMAAAMLKAAATAGPPPSADEVYAAIRAGETKRLERWMAAGWNVNAGLDERGNTALLHAAAVGNAAVVRMLLGAGASVKAVNSLGVAPLIVGAADAAKAKMLVAAGADVNAAAGTGRTPLMVAAAVNGNAATVKMLVERGAVVDQADKMGMNALMLAASAGDLESVRLLLARGAKAAIQPQAGGTALHYAVSSRNAAMVRLLLKHGAKVDAPADFSNQVRHGKVALEKITPLMLAATYGPVELVAMLIDAGASVRARDVRGMTPLLYAVSSETQDPAIVKLLLARGADAGARSQAGETALDWARKFNSPAVMPLLGGTASAPGNNEVLAAGGDGPQATMQRAVKLLQGSQREFFRMSGCVACHHSVTGEMAVRAARERGIESDAAASGEFRRAALGQSGLFAAMQLQMIDVPGAIDTTLYTLAGLDAAAVDPSPVTDALAVYVFRQMREGAYWTNLGISRSPIAEGSLHRTAMAVRMLNRYLPPAYRTEYEGALGRTRAWLKRAAVSTTDDAAMRLLAMKASHSATLEVAAAAGELAKRQRGDGGWGGNPNLASDAYSTGLATYALASAGLADEASRRGAGFLMRTQKADGSWMVASRAAKFQPYFESGFPGGGDQWLSNAATSWAVMGLAAIPAR